MSTTYNGLDVFGLQFDRFAYEHSWIGEQVGEFMLGPNGGGMLEYQHATVFALPEGGAHEVHGPILAWYLSHGGPYGTLGYPISDEADSDRLRSIQLVRTRRGGLAARDGRLHHRWDTRRPRSTPRSRRGRCIRRGHTEHRVFSGLSDPIERSDFAALHLVFICKSALQRISFPVYSIYFGRQEFFSHNILAFFCISVTRADYPSMIGQVSAQSARFSFEEKSRA